MQAIESRADKSDLPLVTIVTPAYNQADYLSETIDSVLAQDYPNIEYIVIDDGSTDCTSEILKQYDGRIRGESQANIGQAATLNRGWQMGSGQIVGYLSADDLLKPFAISESVPFMLRNPEAILVYPDFELIDAKGKFIRKVETLEFDYCNMVQNLVCYPGPGALFWKRFYDVEGGWNPSLRQVPDFEYWVRLSQYGDFKRIPKLMASSRIHEKSQSFREISVALAMEPVRSMAILIESGKIRPDQKECARGSTAAAHLLSFRLLFRSGFYSRGILSLYNAVSIRPNLILSGFFWRVVVGSLLGKSFYRAIFRTKIAS
jgi:glycosyltransferase involved in cell wall biosynthesis